MIFFDDGVNIISVATQSDFQQLDNLYDSLSFIEWQLSDLVATAEAARMATIDKVPVEAMVIEWL